MTKYRRVLTWWTLIWLMSGALVLGCRRQQIEDETDQVSSSTQTAPESSPEAPPEPPWYQGTWSADIEFRTAAPQTGAGLPKEWKENEADSVEGRGQLLLELDEKREARGTLSGVIALTIRGSLDEQDTLRAALEAPSGEEGQTFRGTLVAGPSPGGDAPSAPKSEKSAPAEADFGGGAPVAAQADERTLTGTLRLSSGDSLLVRHAKVVLKRSARPVPAPRLP